MAVGNNSSTAVTSISLTRPSLPLRGRSFRALVLAPETPLGDWFSHLDALVQRSPTLFSERAVILDVSGLAKDSPRGGHSLRGDLAGPEAAEPAEDKDAGAETAPDIAGLVDELKQRGIRIMGVEKAEPAWLGPALPPLLSGGRPTEMAAPPEPEAPKPPEPRKPNSLVLETPLRSGQSVYHPEGDVTVMGSVASGAEILAGGSIHVYGALRGRAIAGAGGNPRARICCRRFEPELIGIDGLFRTADTTDPKLRKKAVQVWLEGETLRMATLD
ncbi:septum site-determining protein MinC [Methylobacterium nonmethylotrophicum]|uniref:Probable septum site-determining protein MinC n=1 Tax=Methylobacterium nonmethylotrophicum TaxID=1141884 RepID=A0A4Z0NN16_9HYPH|nr:septum site-determining protein MinC [Methylobacterium nonmethylotrophicum]TGD97251.1 septum formation inhibitor MinC [Methylobacterium nonmethylotrophicum]